MKTYLCAQGDVWDAISFKIFGDERYMDILIRANPHLRNVFKFDEPTTITIPEKPEIRYESLSSMPPWRR